MTFRSGFAWLAMIAAGGLLQAQRPPDLMHGDARFVSSVAARNPAAAPGSLDATLRVLGEFASEDARRSVGAWERFVDPSPAGRRKTSVFVEPGANISPQAQDRIALLGGTIVRVARPDAAVNAILSQSGSGLRIPASGFAVINDLSFSATWGRPIPAERTPRYFHGKHRTVRSPFLHGGEYAIVDRRAGLRRLVIPLSAGHAEFVWSDSSSDVPLSPLLGTPVRLADSKLYDVVIPRLHRIAAFSLKGALEGAGLGTLFSGRAPGLGTPITDVVQTTDLAFDEFGIKLKADTVGYITLGVPSHPVGTIVIDRPFWFRVSDAANRSVYVARIDDV